MGIPPNISTEKLRLYRILQRVYGSCIKGVVETRGGVECLTIQFTPLPTSQSVGITDDERPKELS